MTQHIYEGTPQELAPFLAKRLQGCFRLIELPGKVVGTTKETMSLPDPENMTSIALLKSWLE